MFSRSCSLYHYKIILFLVFLTFSISGYSQEENLEERKTPSAFWQQVRIGGSLGLSFGNGYFTGALAPSAVYDFNKYVSAGAGLNVAYASRQNFSATSYGGSLIGLLRPIRQIQISAELEQLRINKNFEIEGANRKDQYWVPALYLGAGYNTGNVVAGFRYDVLHDSTKSFNADALTPFVSIYF